MPTTTPAERMRMSVRTARAAVIGYGRELCLLDVRAPYFVPSNKAGILALRDLERANKVLGEEIRKIEKQENQRNEFTLERAYRVVLAKRNAQKTIYDGFSLEYKTMQLFDKIGCGYVARLSLFVVQAAHNSLALTLIGSLAARKKI